MSAIQKDVLQVDVMGVPQGWISRSTAACLVAGLETSWVSDESVAVLMGGTRADGQQSRLAIPSVVAMKTVGREDWKVCFPSLNTRNDRLFARDRCRCAYCGEQFHPSKLSRDHVFPTSRGGEDCWENVVTACMRCNRIKSNRTPEEAGMPLLYQPKAPNYIEDMMMERFNRGMTQQQERILYRHLEMIRGH